MEDSIRVNLTAVQERIASAARRCGRDPAEITLVAVTTTFPAETIRAAIRAGVTDIGENRVQEARDKFPDLQTGTVQRHLIGHLQRNKVKYALKFFDMIQSVDSLKLAEEINARSANSGQKMHVLIQVNTSDEDQKSGCTPEAAFSLLKAIDRLPNLISRGFMTIALYSDDPARVKPCFQQLKQLYEDALSLPLENARIDTLSMGMSSDFELAIAEGATMIRVGSAIFGARGQTGALL